MRAQCAGLAVVAPDGIKEIRRRCLYHAPAGTSGSDYIIHQVRNLARDYNVNTVVVDPHDRIYPWLRSTDLEFKPVELSQAKKVLMNEEAEHTHDALFQHMVERYPHLRRFVTVLHRTGRIATTERWRTVLLLAATLGIATTQARSLTTNPYAKKNQAKATNQNKDN